NELASMFSPARDELITHIDRAAARPLGVHETLEIDGETHHFDAPLDGSAHTLHTALGWLRAWARVGAASASILVVHAGDLYRVDIVSPVRDEIDGKPMLR